MTTTIVIDMDSKCHECGKGGAAQSGVCLACTTKALSGKPMKSQRGQMLQARLRQILPRKPKP